MSKLLKRFLQNIIFPCALLVVSKVAGLYLASWMFDLKFFLDTKTNHFFSIQIYFENTTQAMLANSVSNIVSFATIAIFTAYFLMKYRLSLLTSSNPKVLVKLNNWNLIPWINTKGNSFLKVFIWTMFLWILSIIIIADIISQNSFLWIGVISSICTILLSWILIRTFEIESEINYPHSKTSNLY